MLEIAGPRLALGANANFQGGNSSNLTMKLNNHRCIAGSPPLLLVFLLLVLSLRNICLWPCKPWYLRAMVSILGQ